MRPHSPRRSLLSGLLGSTILLASCGQDLDSHSGSIAQPPTTGDDAGKPASRHSSSAKEATQGNASKTYKLVGKVVSLNREESLAGIKHEAIPGFMPAMTMQFPIEDRELLEELQVGDKVEGMLHVGESDWKLADLVITEMAEPPDMVLDTSGGTPVLRERRPVLKVGEEVPDFAVRTQDGEALRLSELRGKTVVLTFIYTRCPLPDFCPLMDKKFAELSRRLKAAPGRAERVRLLSVSFDPEHDTPEALRRHAKAAGAEPPLWTFAVASHDELRKVAESLGLSYGPAGDEIIHSLSTAVIDGRGRLALLETGNRWDVGEVMKAVVAMIRAGE